MKTDTKVYYINERKENAKKELSNTLWRLLMGHMSEHQAIPDRNGIIRELVFLCIGSDRVTGDSLGPMVGYQLSKNILPGIHIFGTLDHPVHALNLAETMEIINERHPHALTIALDASLGSRRHQGYITIGNGCLYPGAGVNKDLPPVGDIYITGIINLSGSMEYLALQTTRLATIMRMADCITSSILMTCQKYYLKQAFDSNPQLFDSFDDRVFWDLDEEGLSAEKTTTISLRECAAGDSPRKTRHYPE